jgi:mercuric ion binding protein
MERHLNTFVTNLTEMKRLTMLFLLMAGFFVSASAQAKKPVTIKINTPGIKCEECKKRVEDYLKYEEGVTKVVANFRSGYVNVTYFKDRTNLENIKAAIANVGYDADDVTAEPDAYKKLPKTCKKPEDGGHPKN